MDGLRAINKKARRFIKRVLNYGEELFSWTGYGRHGANIEELPLASWESLAASPRDDILSAILLARRDGVVGRGLHLDACIDSEALGIDAARAAEIEHRIEAAFARWAMNAGVDGESFDEIISAAYFSAILSGDCLVDVDMRSGVPRLSVIEGDLVRTPPDRSGDRRVLCGIELSARGRRIAYHCATAYEYNSDGFPVYFIRKPAFMAGFNDLVTGSFLPAKSGALHVHVAFERPGQMRGLPLCSRVMGDLKQLDRYIKAELDASVVSAKPTVFDNGNGRRDG